MSTKRVNPKKWLSLILGGVTALSMMACKDVTNVQHIYPGGDPAEIDNSDGNRGSGIQGQGTINGGGGKGIQCEVDGKVTLEVLDLYEATNIYSLELREVPSDMSQAGDFIADIIGEHKWNIHQSPLEEYKQNLKTYVVDKLLERVKFVESGLAVTHDSFEPLVPQNCKMVQLALYYDESVLMISKPLWDQLDTRNKIGLLTHEILYYLNRLESGATNSIEARKVTGHLLSVDGLRPTFDGAPLDKTKYLSCIADFNNGTAGVAVAYESERENWDGENVKGVEILFTSLKGFSGLLRTTSFLWERSIDEFLANDSFEVPIEIDTYENSGKFIVAELIEGRGTIFIRDSKSGLDSPNYDFYCYRNESELPQTDPSDENSINEGAE